LHRLWVVATVLVLLFAGAADASSLAWGARAGMSAARLLGAYGGQVGPDYRGDFTGGIYASLRLGSGWVFQPEVASVSKGGSGDLRITVSSGGTTQVYDFHMEHHLDYVEIPLLLRYDVTTGGSWSPTSSRVRRRHGGSATAGPT
jgi:hypothetical protein